MSEQELAPIEFDPGELFFSTTDAKGVIQKANSVFVRLSRHPWEELVGAPHNVIRHDEMPGGAFRLMWQTLQAGRPFCAYVKNRAASGAPYTVFATITPLGDGYLSVRSRPCAEALHDAAFSLYAPARALEKEQRARGASAAAAAQAGAQRLAVDLAAAGFPSYHDFVLASLPAEVAARDALAGGLPMRPGDGQLHQLLGRVHAIDAQLADWLGRMDSLAALTTSLREGADALRADMVASGATAQQVAEQAPAGAPVMLAVNVWASMMPEIDAAIDELATELADLAHSCAETRFRIALARLHNDATGQFVAELIDADGDPQAAGSGMDAIVDLARALDEGMAHTAEQGRRNAELAQASATSIENVRDLLGVPQGLLGGWQEKASDSSNDAVSALVPLMAEQMAAGERSSATLGGLAEQCRALAEPLDVTGISDELVGIRGLVAELTAAHAPGGVARPSRGAVDDEVSAAPAAGPRRGLA